MLEFSAWLMLAGICSVSLWSLAMPAHSRLFTAALLFTPVLLSVLLQDWLVRQSLSVWLQSLQPFAPLLALWFSVEAACLARGRPRFWHALLPGPWFALLYWQLQCLQSGVLSCPFLPQLLGIALLMMLAMGLGQCVVRQGGALRRLKTVVAVRQWVLGWWWACRWPQQSGTATVDIAETAISIGVLLSLVLIGMVIEQLHKRFFSKEYTGETLS